jgi:hypothetical protein
MDAKKLVELALHLLSKKLSLNSLHQEIADNFYPERADFTLTRSIGTDFAANLMSSYPVQCRRELGNQFGTMLRPTARPWFHPGIRHEPMRAASSDARIYLEWFERTQRRAMYDPAALLARATSQGDHDYAAFGQCALSVQLNRVGNGLLYRCWHLRDMAWQENEEGNLGLIVRKWKPTAQDLVRLFKDKVDPKVKEIESKSPFDEIECLHMVVEADMYDDKANGRPRWSIYYDTTNDKLIEATPIWGRHYIIPRWQTVSGSQYSYSPATVCALPDARLLQAMTFTLLEAGEKATSPPMIATQDAIKSDVAVYAGGITWVDMEYDEKLGEALRPLTQDFRGFNYGVQMNQDTRALLMRAFFLDTLKLPANGPEMTAFEVGQRVQEYIRAAMPIFGPTEMEYNAALCDETFDILARNGAFGAPQTWPKELRGAEIDFTFESPLHDVIEQQKGQKFQEASQLIAAAISLDPTAAYVPNAIVALRDALTGIGVPATWMNSQADVDEKVAQGEAQAESQQRLANMEQASNAVKNFGASGMVPGPSSTAGAMA